ncbi:heparan-alpha-glucosaminide N-acetyltransferase domain-containing protein [Fannyhessea vaginae]|uniref:heparan-alpha-glucosaminide N-acetyltransferase domain-containing protein n=1 Tax=Fannyhessea vaginae TaxID=82135 RepID=UPI003A80A578
MHGSQRIEAFDVIRGFSLVSMIAFHACYDLVSLYGVSLTWFVFPYIDLWRNSIAWVFIFLAGIMCAYSVHKIKRCVVYLVCAFLIYVVTTLVAVDIPINFGIIFCLGMSTTVVTLVSYMLSLASKTALFLKVNTIIPSFMVKVGTLILLCAMLGLFGITYHIPHGYISFFQYTWRLPACLYSSYITAAFGFAPSYFQSGDYYPIFPYVFLYSGGALAGWLSKSYVMTLQTARSHKESVTLTHGFSVALLVYGLTFIKNLLALMGRHSLQIYVLHQPLLCVLIFLCMNWRA